MQTLSNSRLGGGNLKAKANVAPTLDESPVPIDIVDLKILQGLESTQKIESPNNLGDLTFINKR
jgi:hypothetical protein